MSTCLELLHIATNRYTVHSLSVPLASHSPTVTSKTTVALIKHLTVIQVLNIDIGIY